MRTAAAGLLASVIAAIANPAAAAVTAIPGPGIAAPPEWLCAKLMRAIEIEEKELSAVAAEDPENDDDSAPRVAMRAAEAARSATIIQINVDLMVANRCTPIQHTISTRAFLLDAQNCAKQSKYNLRKFVAGGPAACDRSKWTRLGD